MDLFFSWFWDSQLEPMTPTVGANEGSVSTVWSAEGKRPEFVGAKRAASLLQGRAATIERTEHMVRVRYSLLFLRPSDVVRDSSTSAGMTCRVHCPMNPMCVVLL